MIEPASDPVDPPAGATAPDDEWFYGQGGVRYGPVPGDALRAMLLDGRVGGADLVWRQGMIQWAPAQSVRELLPKTPPPLPPTAPRPVAPVPAPTLPSPFPAVGWAGPVAAGERIGYASPEPPPAVRADDIGQDPKMRLLLPVGRSPLAIVAGYLGLFSFLLVPAPFAILCGIFAIRDIRRDPNKHGMGRAYFGIIAGGVGTFVLAATVYHWLG